jgi:putative hydrolase of the HAD superfamily
MIETVNFDIGNVLIDVDFMRSIRHYTKNDIEAKRCFLAFIKDQNWDLLDKGIYSTEEVMQKFIENDPEMEPYMRDFFEEMNDLLIPFEYIDSWIESIKENGKSIYILSNWPKFVHEKFVKEMGFLKKVDGYLLSYMENLTKPDPAYYQLLLDRYSLSAEHCVFVDDQKENIVAAEEMGIKGILNETQKQVEHELQELGIQVKG